MDKKYIAVLGLCNPATHIYTGSRKSGFDVIAKARKWAESFGVMADWCCIYLARNYINKTGYVSPVALHLRDINASVPAWYTQRVTHRPKHYTL